MTPLVTVDHVREAEKMLVDVARQTPVEPARGLPEWCGDVRYKCENLQRAGAYKLRGAYVRIHRLTAAERDRGVVAASAGNHAQGVAVAAAELGAKATVFMPTSAPLPKVAATRDYGAEVELVGDTVDDALAEARAYAERTGAVFIHPFDHADVIAGQGTVGLEILRQAPDVRTIVAGVGGGGLISGIAVVARALRPDVRVIGVQAEGAAAFPPSLAAGRPTRLENYATLADGIRVGIPGELTFPHVRDLVDEIVTVSDEDISRAMLTLLERNKLVVEPAGAVGAAAIQSGVISTDGPTVAVLSGGNIDPLLLLRVIEHGLAAAGRFHRFTVTCSDRPGALAAILGLIAERGGNVVDVLHQRSDPQLRVGEVSVAMSVETRGLDHAAHLMAALRDSGYHIHPGRGVLLRLTGFALGRLIGATIAMSHPVSIVVAVTASLEEILDPGWAKALSPVSDQITAMGQFLRDEIAEGRKYLPAGDKVLRAFTQPFDEVRVLIVGQDPYPTPGHAIGLSFAVAEDVRPLPPSLRNIFKEYMEDLELPPPANGDLTPWANQGVLLLNRSLTVRPGEPNSHKGKGWEKVTEQAIKALAERGGPLVAILWGRDARNLKPLLKTVPCIESAHPSPMAARYGFFGSRPFSRANAALVEQNGQPIDWTLPAMNA